MEYVANHYKNLAGDAVYLITSDKSVNTSLRLTINTNEYTVLRIYESPTFNDEGSGLVLANTSRELPDYPKSGVYVNPGVEDDGFLIYDSLILTDRTVVLSLNGDYLVRILKKSSDGAFNAEFFINEEEVADGEG